jgi:cell pole-organizing protein PopZ
VGLDIKVEDILSNIRKSVDSDFETLSHGTTSQSRGTLMRGALREMRISMGVESEVQSPPNAEISDLRSRIKKKMAAIETESLAQAARVAPAPSRVNAVVPARGDFSGILTGPSRSHSGLRPGYAERDTRDDLRYAPPPEQPQHWPEPEPYQEYEQPEDHYAQGYGYEEQPYQQALEVPLMSPQTEAHAETAFRQLSDAILARATGDRSLEDMTREMLKGMLKQWLDANLPTIVEELVREEIQRVARRGR